MASAENEPVIASSNRYNDVLPYTNKLFGVDPLLWGSIMPWEFPQNGTRDQEQQFLLKFFSEREIRMQGGEPDGYRFLKQVWYTAALWNLYHRLPLVVEWWFQNNQDLVNDASMKAHCLKPDVQPQTFFQAAEIAMYGEKFLEIVVKQIQFQLEPTLFPVMPSHKPAATDREATIHAAPTAVAPGHSRPRSFTLATWTAEFMLARSPPGAPNVQLSAARSLNPPGQAADQSAITKDRFRAPQPRNFSGETYFPNEQRQDYILRNQCEGKGYKPGTFRPNQVIPHHGFAKATDYGQPFSPPGMTDQNAGFGTRGPQSNQRVPGSTFSGAHEPIHLLPQGPEGQALLFQAPPASCYPQMQHMPPQQDAPFQPTHVDAMDAMHAPSMYHHNLPPNAYIMQPLADRSNRKECQALNGDEHSHDFDNQSKRRESVNSRGSRNRGSGGSMRGRNSRGRASFGQSSDRPVMADNTDVREKLPYHSGDWHPGFKQEQIRRPTDWKRQPQDESTAVHLPRHQTTEHGASSHNLTGQWSSYNRAFTQGGDPSGRLPGVNGKPRCPPCTMGCSSTFIDPRCSSACKLILFGVPSNMPAAFITDFLGRFGEVYFLSPPYILTDNRVVNYFVTFFSVKGARACLAAKNLRWPDAKPFSVEVARDHFDPERYHRGFGQYSTRRPSLVQRPAQTFETEAPHTRQVYELVGPSKPGKRAIIRKGTETNIAMRPTEANSSESTCSHSTPSTPRKKSSAKNKKRKKSKSAAVHGGPTDKDSESSSRLNQKWRDKSFNVSKDKPAATQACNNGTDAPDAVNSGDTDDFVREAPSQDAQTFPMPSSKAKTSPSQPLEDAVGTPDDSHETFTTAERPIANEDQSPALKLNNCDKLTCVNTDSQSGEKTAHLTEEDQNDDSFHTASDSREDQVGELPFAAISPSVINSKSSGSDINAGSNDPLSSASMVVTESQKSEEPSTPKETVVAAHCPLSQTGTAGIDVENSPVLQRNDSSSISIATSAVDVDESHDTTITNIDSTSGCQQSPSARSKNAESPLATSPLTLPVTPSNAQVISKTTAKPKGPEQTESLSIFGKKSKKPKAPKTRKVSMKVKQNVSNATSKSASCSRVVSGTSEPASDSTQHPKKTESSLSPVKSNAQTEVSVEQRSRDSDASARAEDTESQDVIATNKESLESQVCQGKGCVRRGTAFSMILDYLRGDSCQPSVMAELPDGEGLPADTNLGDPIQVQARSCSDMSSESTGSKAEGDTVVNTDNQVDSCKQEPEHYEGECKDHTDGHIEDAVDELVGLGISSDATLSVCSDEPKKKDKKKSGSKKKSRSKDFDTAGTYKKAEKDKTPVLLNNPEIHPVQPQQNVTSTGFMTEHTLPKKLKLSQASHLVLPPSRPSRKTIKRSSDTRSADLSSSKDHAEQSSLGISSEHIGRELVNAIIPDRIVYVLSRGSSGQFALLAPQEEEQLHTRPTGSYDMNDLSTDVDRSSPEVQAARERKLEMDRVEEAKKAAAAASMKSE